MKKIYQFIRSMRFGMILLTFIGVLCVIATVKENAEIYSSWYFILLFVMLGLNLTLCSVLRARRFRAQRQVLLRRAIITEPTLVPDNPEEWLQKHHFKRQDDGYLKHRAGFLGSFLTHSSMLLLMLSAALIFTYAERQDISICVGDKTELSDGTQLTVEAFSLEDETGKAEYTSTFSVRLPDGSETNGIVQVNHPLRAGRYTVYQQNYAYAAVLGIKTAEDESEELIRLDEPAFLTLDGENGIYYSQMFGNTVEEGGEVRVSHNSEIIHPAYEVRITEYGREQTGLVYPGTTITAGGMFCTFYEPEAYPGFQIKTQPEWALWMLYGSFVIMTAGLFLCFFHVPEAAYIKPDGITIVGQKDITMQIEEYREEIRQKKENR